MSTVSAASNRLDKSVVTDLEQELEALRSMNSSLRTYLEHLQGFKRNLASVNNNCKQLSKVNSKWIDTLKTMSK